MNNSTHLFLGHKNEWTVLFYKHIRYGMKVLMHLIFHEHKQEAEIKTHQVLIKQSNKITALTHSLLFILIYLNIMKKLLPFLNRNGKKLGKI